VETVLNDQSPIPANTYAVQSITTPETGRLVLTLDWVKPTDILSLVLAQAPCTLEVI
jgi:hypothetical protein